MSEFGARLVADQLRLANLLTAAYTLGSSEATAALRINIGTGDAPVYRLRPEIADLLGLVPDADAIDAEIVDAEIVDDDPEPS